MLLHHANLSVEHRTAAELDECAEAVRDADRMVADAYCRKTGLSSARVRALMAREGIGLVAVTGPGGMTVGCVTTQLLLTREPGGRDTAKPHESSRLIPLLRPEKGTVKVCVPL